VIAIFVSALAIGLVLNVARIEIARVLELRRRQRGNGKILVIGNADHPALIATTVIVTYESATINGCAGHRFTVLRWLDDRRLGGGWMPGALSAAQREVAELCAREAWEQQKGRARA
jgi:hypothetical protein